MFVLPGDDFSRNQVTPYQCSLLVLIKEYAVLFDGKNKKYPRMNWQDEWSSKRRLNKSLLMWIQQPDGSLKDVLRTVNICSKSLYNEFTSSMANICNYDGIGNLEDFFMNLGNMIFEEKNSLLHKRGLLGLFCRRMLVHYERQSFCEIQPFFENFIKYCSPHILLKQPLAERVSKVNESLEIISPMKAGCKDTDDDMELESQSEMDSKSSRDSIDAVLKPSDLKSEKSEDFEVSEQFAEQQAEFFFSQQAALIETKESEALSPAALQNKIRLVLKNNPELTQAYYVSYLNNLRLREFCGAMDSLFMYFIRHNKKFSPLSLKRFKEQEVSRTQRFATLNLALLHWRFGHKKAALAAVKESISLSQLSNDAVCLQHAVSLLHHIEQKASTSQQVASEIVKPAKSQNLADLAFLAVQAHTGRLSSDGGKPCVIFRNLAAADLLQCSRPFNHFASTSCVHKASLWRMYGKRQMALLHCQLALSMQATIDKKSCFCPSRYNPEDVALCLSHFMELSYEEGFLNSYADLLNHAKIRFPPNSKHSHFWQKTEARLSHQLNLRLCKQTEARQSQQVLMSHDLVEATLRKAESEASQNEIIQSQTTLHELLRRDNSNDDLTIEIECQIHLLIGDLLSRNACQQASSFRYLLQALSISRKSFLHKFANEALLKIAQLQIISGAPEVALACLKAITVECMTNGSLHSRSKLMLVAIRCLMKLRKTNAVKDNKACIATLRTSLEGFERTQDLARQRDVIYLLAKLHEENSQMLEAESSNSKIYLDSTRQRNECALEFKRLDLQMGSLKYTPLL